LGDGLNVADSAELKGLDNNTTYSFQPYKDGFIAYDTAFTKVFYFASIKSDPEAIKIDQPKDGSQGPITLRTYGDKIVASYGDFRSLVGDSEDVSSTPSNVKSSVSIYSQGKTKQLTLNKQFIDVRLCGTDKICVVGGQPQQNLTVYDVSGDSAKSLYTINDVSSVENNGSTLLVVKNSGIIALDVDKQSGYTQFSMGSLGLCGIPIQTVSEDYLFCVTNSLGQNVALHIDPSQNNSDSIDKKVQELQKLPGVQSVSAYKKFLFVTLKLNADVFDEDLRSFVFDPTIKKQLTDSVNNQVKDLGIDRTAYTIRILPE